MILWEKKNVSTAQKEELLVESYCIDQQGMHTGIHFSHQIHVCTDVS